MIEFDLRNDTATRVKPGWAIDQDGNLIATLNGVSVMRFNKDGSATRILLPANAREVAGVWSSNVGKIRMSGVTE